jgi:hypothetical protein
VILARSGAGLYGSDSSGNRTKAAVAELIGTAILVYAGTAVAVAAILERPTAGPASDSPAIALAFGLALAALVGALGHTSGAHLPAVTIAMAATNNFPRQYVLTYVASGRCTTRSTAPRARPRASRWPPPPSRSSSTRTSSARCGTTAATRSGSWRTSTRASCSGVDGTPTLFINGSRHDDATDQETLRAAIAAHAGAA